MFKDTDKALARLEAELLREDEKTQPLPEEVQEAYDYEEVFETEPEEEPDLPPEYIYTDTRAADGPVIYQNFSNNYGKDLRNFANGYQAYNTDVSDEDLDSFSEEILQPEPEKSNVLLILIACLLTLGIIGMIFVWLIMLQGGL